MGSQGPGRKRTPSKNGLTGEEDALNLIAREAEARLAAKRAARAEAREIRMKELERQQKEIYQVQKKYYGLDNLDNKFGDIEQWMEDSERYTRLSRRHASVSDDEERMSVGSRSSMRLDLDAPGAYGGLSQASSSSHSHKKSKKKKKHSSKTSNGYDDDLSPLSSRNSRLSDESKRSRSSRLDLQSSIYNSEPYSSSSYSSKHQGLSYNGYQGSVYEDSLYSGSRRSVARTSSEYSGFIGSSSRTSSRANSACASPVEDCSSSVASYIRSSSISGLSRDLDHVKIPDLPDVNGRLSMADDRIERDYLEKGSSRASTISGATLTSLGGTSSRRGSGDTTITADTEASIREIKEIHELKDQIQDVEAKHMQNLKELKDSLSEVEEKYRKAMVSNAQLDNEKTNLIYEVDTLKDSLMELEEMLSETRRELEEKNKDLEREKHAHSILQFQFNELKETLKQSEELLTEIRQLRLKQDGFVSEISDLQETIEWKNKKIGALERQKEFSDAIRNERDELRDEVVQLKDILKKHGIVLGPDLTTNGETGEEVGEGDQSSQTSSAEIREGSSVLGIQQLKMCKDQKDLDEEVQENHDSLISTKTSLEANDSGDLRDKVNQGVKQQSDNKPEEPQSSVNNDELTTTRPMVEIKAEQLVLEDSRDNTVESECEVHTDGPVEKNQQETTICAKHSQIIEKETSIESVSDPVLYENQLGEAVSKPVEKPAESSQTEKPSQTQGANETSVESVSGPVLDENQPGETVSKPVEKPAESSQTEKPSQTQGANETSVESVSGPVLDENQPGETVCKPVEKPAESSQTEKPSQTQGANETSVESVSGPVLDENQPGETVSKPVEKSAESSQTEKPSQTQGANETCVESVSGPVLDENQPGETVSKPVEKPAESSQTEKPSQTEGANVSNKKRRKKKKSKQKQKQNDKQESETKIGGKSEKILNEDNPDQKLESDLEGNHEEQLGNDASTAVHTEVPADSHDNKRNIETDCVEIISMNTIPADDARDQFRVITDVVDSGETSNPKTDFDCPESTTGNSISNLTEVIDDQTKDSVNLAQEISSDKEALLSHELSDKSMEAVNRCVETLESISISKNIEKSLLVDEKEGKSHVDSDAVEEEPMLQIIDPGETTFPGSHDESAPKCHPSSSVTEKVENECEKLIQEQPTMPTDQKLENHLQNTIEVEQKKVKTQTDQDDLVEEVLIMHSREVFSGDNNIDTAITESQDQILEKGEGEEERSLHDELLPEAQHIGEDEADQESIELGDSHHESKLEKGEDENKTSFKDQVMLDTQLPVEDKDILVGKGEEDGKKTSVQDQVMVETQPTGKGEDILVGKTEEDEKEGSVQGQVMLDTQLSVEDKAILVGKVEEDEKERSVRDQVMLEMQTTGNDEDILLNKGEEDENEESVQVQAMLDTQPPGENEDILVEKREEDYKERSVQNQVMIDTQLSGEDEGILVESVTVSPEQKEEDEEEDEGESFDFDEMDLEASSDDPLKQCQDKPNEVVTPLKESVQEDQTQNDSEPLELADQESMPKNQMDDGQTIENPQTTTKVEACLTEDNQVDQKDIEPNQQQHDTSESKECTFEKHQQASEELRHNEGADLTSEIETQNVEQEMNSYIIHENQGPQISREQEVAKPTAGNGKEDDRKEAKKSSKKGKGKGKEECKMS